MWLASPLSNNNDNNVCDVNNNGNLNNNNWNNSNGVAPLASLAFFKKMWIYLLLVGYENV